MAEVNDYNNGNDGDCCGGDNSNDGNYDNDVNNNDIIIINIVIIITVYMTGYIVHYPEKSNRRQIFEISSV